MLSIGIPTRNRKESLYARLEELRPLVEEHGLHVIVSDNSEGADPDIERKFPFVDYSWNSSNIGGGANFLRLIERCDSDWIWLRGDDDPIVPEIVLPVLARLPELEASGCDAVILATNLSEDVFLRDSKSVVENFHIVRNAGWISNVIFHVPSAKRSIRWGYFGIASGFAHFALILGMTKDSAFNGILVIPRREREGLFRDGLVDAAPKWNYLETMLDRFPRVFDVFDFEARKMVYRRWASTLSMKSLLRALVGTKTGYYNPEVISWRMLRYLRCGKRYGLAVALFFLAKIPASWYCRFLPMAGNVLRVRLPESLVGKSAQQLLADYRNITSNRKREPFI